MEKCIYCNSDGSFSEEHALSRSLGEFRDSPMLINRVCAICNENIGKLEEQFGRSGPEAFFRRYLNIQGRDTHVKVNPFQRGSAGAKPIDFKAGEFQCDYCRMTIMDMRYKAEIVSSKGKIFRLDSIECLLHWGKEHPSEVGSQWVTDFRHPNHWIKLDNAYLLLTSKV